MNYVIIGNGPAGVSAVERIREIDDQGRMILVSKENNLPYSRIMTPEYMTGEVNEEDVYRRPSDFYERYQVETRLGRCAAQVIPDQNTVILDDGEELNYDRLLVASGSRPFTPPWVDLTVEGVFTLWDKADSERIKQYLPKVRHAVIVGAGLVGLQAARALTTYGIKVTLIERMNRIMPLQIDETAGTMLIEVIKRTGIEIHLNTDVLSLRTEGQKMKAVQLKEQEIPADMVLISTGIRPNLDMVMNTGLTIKQGLIVNNLMQTSIENIYAAGDVAQAPCQLTGELKLRALWPCAVQQGKVAGAAMAGKCEPYKGSIPMNSFHLFGLSVLSFGLIEGGADIEEQILQYPASGSYQKLLLQDGKLQGLIFVGDIQQAGTFYYKIGNTLERNESLRGSFSSFLCEPSRANTKR